MAILRREKWETSNVVILQVRVGMSVGHSPDEAQWTPDMRKNEQDITEAEKKEAMRRIQGSVAVEESSPGDSGDEGGPRGGMGRRPTLDTLAASAM